MIRRRTSAQGQATTEMLIAIVAITVVFFAVIQFGLFGDINTQNAIDARAEAEWRAFDSPVMQDSEFIANWTTGPDGLDYTADDEITGGDGDFTNFFDDAFNAPLSLGYLDSIGMVDPVSPLLDGGSIVWAADLYEGEATATVELENGLIEFLFLTVSQLTLQDKAYFPGGEIQ